MECSDIKVIKKDGTQEDFHVEKIIAAINKSAARILYKFSGEEIQFICQYAKERAASLGKEALPFRKCTILWRGLWSR